MLKRLRWRFVLITMSLVTVILLGIFYTVYHATRQNLEIQSITILREVTTLSVKSLRPGESDPQVNLPFFSLRQEDGAWVADRGSFYDLSDVDYLQELAAAAEEDGAEFGVLDEYGLRYYRTATPRGVQIVFADVTSEQDTLRMLVESCLIIGVLSFSVFLAISSLLSRWAVRPVDVAWRQQKQFVADASHELKTPLTVIQTSTELLRQTEDERERRHYTVNILEMSRRMRRLVEELLMLARADNGQPLQNTAPVDFSRTASEALLPFEPIFFEAGLTLSSHIAGGITLRGDGMRLRQLVDILLDNARKYTTPGGEAVLTLERSGKYALLRLSNPAAPMTPQQCRDVFKRFYRSDSARTGGESFGLGLSIAESIVRQHGGEISAAMEGDRFTVRTELPIRE